jgi:penicillin-binding protein 2
VKRSVVLALGLFLAGCGLFHGGEPQPSPVLPTPAVTSITPPNPEGVVAQFLDRWVAGDYGGMYALLSPLSQDGISPEDFIERYENVHRAAALTGLEYEILSSLVVNPRSAQVAYRLTLQSAVVGDVTRDTTIDLSLVGSDWRVAWAENAILPELAGGNRLSMTYVNPTRANIYDRDGLAFAAQTEVVGFYLVPNQITSPEAETDMLSALSNLMDRRPEAIQELYEPLRFTDYFTALGEASLEEFQRYQDTLAAAGGIWWQVYPSRYYPYGGLAVHGVGYVSQITAEELQDYQARGYAGDEYVGSTGLERVYEDELRGQPGGTLYVLDPNDQVVAALAARDPSPPQSIYTTLNRDLQRYAEQAIVEFVGAIVVLERDSGAVLAMVSSPDFNPNMFDTQNPNSPYEVREIQENPNQPFVDRATDGLYPLGSVSKIITMSAALESGFYTPDSEYICNGEFTELPGFVGLDWTVEKGLPDHGEITLMQGLERSCNPYFWHIGLDLYNRGLTTALPDMAVGFGLGESTGIEIGDSAGLVPNPEWKLETTGEGWAPGDSVQLAIGQASLSVTPLQVARFVAAVGNGGTLYRPYMVERIQTAEGQVTYQGAPEATGTLPVSDENLTSVQDAMVQVVRAERGTARRRFLGLRINVAGKTGTATTFEGAEPHAWFAGYTFEGREDLPDIAIAVVVENGGEGSEVAAPIFRRVVEAYFFGQPTSLYPWESQIGVRRTETPTPGPEEAPVETPSP